MEEMCRCPTGFILDKMLVLFEILHFLPADKQRHSVEQGEFGIQEHGNMPWVAHLGPPKTNGNVHKVEMNCLAMFRKARSKTASDS